MPRTYVNRLLLTTLYRDLCTIASEEFPASAGRHIDRRTHSKTVRGDLHRQLCFFPSSSYIGEREGFALFRMPEGTEHGNWTVAVPLDRTDRMSHKSPTQALAHGFVVRYPRKHFAYPIVSGHEQSIIETDEIQRELVMGEYTDMLPIDSVCHWVRVGGGRCVRLKRHGLHSGERRVTVTSRIAMRDYWNDQYFQEGSRLMFLDGLHATTKCRIVGITKSMMRDLATDGSDKAESRAVGLGSLWVRCEWCGNYGPFDYVCKFVSPNGARRPTFSFKCRSCGRDCTPEAVHEMNDSIAAYADLNPNAFASATPSYNILRPSGQKASRLPDGFLVDRHG